MKYKIMLLFININNQDNINQNNSISAVFLAGFCDKAFEAYLLRFFQVCSVNPMLCDRSKENETPSSGQTRSLSSDHHPASPIHPLTLTRFPRLSLLTVSVPELK